MGQGRLTLERIVQAQGFASRKGSRQLVLDGRVAVDGEFCRDPGRLCQPLQLTVDGVAWPCLPRLYLALNKPADYECSQAPQHHRSVYSLLPRQFIARGVQSAGRLDADTTGLLLLSDDGQWLHALAAPRRHVSKTYVVGTHHPLDAGQVAALSSGVQLHDEPALLAADHCRQLAERQLTLTLSQGKYHQVKRMVAAAGNRVETLQRVAIGGLRLSDDLPGLQPGEWCYLDAGLLARLGT